MTSEPIFKPVFGKSWSDLPPVMHKHYANHPYSNDKMTVEGKLDVMCKWYLRPLLALFGAVPAITEQGVPTTVHFTSQPDSNAFCFDRVFHFKGRKPYHFLSRMYPVKDNEIMEVMRFGLCWHSYYGWDGEKVTLRHKGYSLRLFGYNIRFPITFLLGRGDANEIAISDNRFEMCVTLTHPLLGKVYEYKGWFEVVE